MKFIKLFENFENTYTLGDVIFDAYEINYVLDEQNIIAYYSFAIYSNLNANLSTYQIGSTDPEDSDAFIKKLKDGKLIPCKMPRLKVNLQIPGSRATNDKSTI